MKRKRKTNAGGARPGSGRKKGEPTEVLAVRISAGHKARFIAAVPKKQRRKWVEARIDGKEAR